MTCSDICNHRSIRFPYKWHSHNLYQSDFVMIKEVTVCGAYSWFFSFDICRCASIVVLFNTPGCALRQLTDRLPGVIDILPIQGNNYAVIDGLSLKIIELSNW